MESVLQFLGPFVKIRNVSWSKKKNESCCHYPIPDLTVCSSKDVIYEKLTDFTVESVKLKSISISFSMAYKGIAGH